MDVPPKKTTVSSSPRPFLITFSGIDGAGKSTQIERLATTLRQAGFRVSLVSFWDDVAALRQFREAAGHTLFRGEKGVGAPGKPVRRRDKNVQSFYMLPIRLCLCLLDALRLRHTSRKLARNKDADILIFDRYLYDQLANLNVRNPVVRIYVRALLRLVSRPDLAFLLDADPILACARKPEYPLAFVRHNRDAYFETSKIAGMHVVSPGTPADVENRIKDEVDMSMRRIHDWPVAEALTST